MDSTEVFTGVVIFFSSKRGYGFISWSKDGVPQKDLFLYYSDIDMKGFKTVKKDDKVSFSLGLNNKNQPKAINLKVLE